MLNPSHIPLLAGGRVNAIGLFHVGLPVVGVLTRDVRPGAVGVVGMKWW